MKILTGLLIVPILATASLAQTIPSVKAKSLGNSDVTIPDPGNRRALILVVGFSHKGGELQGVGQEDRGGL